MILYNMIAWPFIHESTNKKRPIQAMESEKDRARAIVSQVEAVVNNITGIMDKV